MRTAQTSRLLDLKQLLGRCSGGTGEPGESEKPGESEEPGAPDLEDLAPRLFKTLTSTLPGVPAALLDSSDHARTSHPARSAHSILAFSFGPHAATVRHRQGQTSVTTATGTLERRQPFFDWLAENWAEAADTPAGDGKGAEALDDLPRFALGWVGWLGYELKREAGSPDASGTMPRRPSFPAHEASLFRATHAVVIHHGLRELELQCLDAAEESDWQQQVTRSLAGLALKASPGDGGLSADDATDGAPDGALLRDVAVRDSRSDYIAAIARAKREITEGNSYEICLTTAVTGTLAPGCPRGVDLFTVLRSRNRAPFTQFLSIGETEILSTSPERFLSISAAGTVRSEPIKGTRPRGATAEKDRAIIDDLRHHPKDRAENVMIADLVRNDLSIHAIPGTLRTERLCAVETYPSVHQLVSTISARVPDDVPRARVVADAFPPGSMTGAPKISTMDILQRLETGPRGPYSGVAGYFSSNGAADLAVLIRTAVLSGEQPSRRLHLGLGGAITADSDPAEEWDEIRTKSRGVLEALGARFPDPEDPALA